MRRIFRAMPVNSLGIRQIGIIFLVLLFVIIGLSAVKGSTDNNVINLRTSSNYVRLNEFIAVSIELSKKSAQVIRDVKAKHLEDIKVKGKTNEGMDEPVTVADFQSNSIFVNGIRQRFADLSILSEETEPPVVTVETTSSAHTLSLKSELYISKSDSFVSIDPLDATQEYSEDLLQYVTTMVCLVENDRPVLGILQSVFSDEIIVAVPAFNYIGRLGSDTPVVNEHVSDNNRIVVSRSHTGGAADVIKEKLSAEFVSFPAGGSGYKSIFLVKGEAKAYLHTTKIKVWDVCAADALITAAGGIMTDLDGNELKYKQNEVAFENGLLAAMDHSVHRNILSKLKN